MSIFQNILTKFSALQKELAQAVTLEAAELADGTMVEAPMFEVGQVVLVPVDDGEAIPLPAGVYDLDNKLTITTDDQGVILAVAPTETQDAETPGTTEAAAPPPVAPAEEMAAKRVIETQTSTKERVFSREELEATIDNILEAKLSAINTEKSEMAAQIEALKIELAAVTAERPISRAPKKSTEDATYFAEPKTAHERLLNLSKQFKTVEK
jgi:hypothetical protein